MLYEIWDVKPRKSCGPLVFGMGFSEVIERLDNADYTVFKRFEDDEFDEYIFQEIGVFLKFDEQFLLNYIALFRPNNGMLEGISLLDRPTTDVRHDLVCAKLPFIDYNNGLWSEELQLLLFAVDGCIDCVELYP